MIKLKKIRSILKYHEYSGNVFAQMGRPNANELLIKAEFVRQITHLIKDSKLTPTKAAKFLGLDKERFNDLIFGALSSFSLDELQDYVGKFGYELEVVLRPIKEKLAKKKIMIPKPTRTISKKRIIIPKPALSEGRAIYAKKK